MMHTSGHTSLLAQGALRHAHCLLMKLFAYNMHAKLLLLLFRPTLCEHSSYVCISYLIESKDIGKLLQGLNYTAVIAFH